MSKRVISGKLLTGNLPSRDRGKFGGDDVPKSK